MLRPLFPGSSESDQLYKVTSLLGTPKQLDWPEGYRLAHAIGYRFPQFVVTPLDSIIRNAGAEACHLMNQLMQWDPSRRTSAGGALQHSYFAACTMPQHAQSSAKENVAPSVQQNKLPSVQQQGAR